jgi:limonene-1,2-epoxide hydrolase
MTSSQETLVRELLASFAHPDVEKVLGHVVDDVEYADARGEYHGIDELRKLLVEDFEIAESDAVEVRAIASSGNTVLVERIDHPTMKGEQTMMEIVAVFEFNEDGRIKRWHEYFGRSSAGWMQEGASSGS